jgi:hypothetical protein
VRKGGKNDWGESAMKKFVLVGFAVLLSSVARAGEVSVTAPLNNSTVTGAVKFVATALTSCPSGVASMGIYTAPFQLAYVANASSLNTSLALSPGTYNTVVQEWDHCGGYAKTPITINVIAGNVVTVTSPLNGSTVSGGVQFSATAISSCAAGVGSMGIYSAPYQLAYVVNGASLNTSLNLAPGTYNTVVQEWDNCGGYAKTPVTIHVVASASSAVSVTSPLNGSTVSGPVRFSATATSSCAQGVTSMGIYTAPYQRAYVVNGRLIWARGLITPWCRSGTTVAGMRRLRSRLPHPSIGNYFMLTAGQIISNDDALCSSVTQDNIVRYLMTAGKTWKAYAESLPSIGLYRVRYLSVCETA